MRQCSSSTPDQRCPVRRTVLRVPITAALLLGFGTLVLVAVASVLILGFSTSSRNTAALLSDKVLLAMDGMTVRVRAQLDPARYQAEFLAASIGRGEIDPADTTALGQNLRSALAASPQITAVVFMPAGGHVWTAAVRHGPLDAEVKTGPADDDLSWVGDVPADGKAHWREPVWSREGHTSFLGVAAKARAGDGRVLGTVMVGVSFADLSAFLGELDSSDGVTAFILYDANHVLAHPALVGRTFDLAGRTPPLPTLTDVGDPVAAAIWQRDPPGRIERPGAMSGKLRDLDFRQATVQGRDYVYLLHDISEYGAQNWTLVMALPQSMIDQELRRLRWFAIGGVAILLVSLAISVVMGKAIARQVKGVSRAATALRELDFSAVDYLPDSRLKEMSDAAAAFNAMLAGLKWFEAYVPKALVLRLIRRGNPAAGAVPSEERDVTVMFTDIRGFSTVAQKLTPTETAALLNEHFTRVAACIEAEGGTVDKFIGDGIMAFWGAPDDQHDHAARALRAAAAIAEGVRARHQAADANPGQCAPCDRIRLRVGIHSGPVIVGNIGARTRINYTIVGDTVNMAARLEALGNDLDLSTHAARPGATVAADGARLEERPAGGASVIARACDPCVVLVSDDTVSAAGECGVALEDTGFYSLRGRSGRVRVWRLIG